MSEENRIDTTQIKAETVKVTVVGVYPLAPGEEVPKGVSQVFEIHMPPSERDFLRSGMLVAESVNKNGILVQRSPRIFDMYHPGTFERVNIEFEHVTGVTL